MKRLSLPNPGDGARTGHTPKNGRTGNVKYRVVPRVPIFDAHDPIEKVARVPKLVSPENPDGTIKIKVGATVQDLREMTTNVNQAVAAGSPPSIQIGHTKFWDAPEPWHPRHVGHLGKCEIGEFRGRPTMFCDLHYLEDEFDEAKTYPRPSAERSGFDVPGQQTIKAVALLRRKPERDLGLIPYEFQPDGHILVCYSRELPEAPPSMDFTPDQVELISSAFEKVLVNCMPKLLAAALHGKVEPEPTNPGEEPPGETTPAPAVAEAKYEAASPMGNNTYVPGMTPDPKDKAAVAAYEKACRSMANYAAEVPKIQDTVASLVAENTRLRNELASTLKIVTALQNESLQAKINYEADQIRNSLKEIERQGVVIDYESQMGMILAIPPEKRADYLKQIEVNYARTGIGDGFIPEGPPRTPSGKPIPNDPASARKIVDYGLKHGITIPSQIISLMQAEGLL